MSLDWQTLHLPFARGLNQKVDSRALQPPDLARAVDVQFDELGALTTRKPYTDLTTTGLGSTTRRIYANGSELVAFGQTSLLSYAPNGGGWLNRGTHLAVDVDEQTRFATTDDQVEVDRAELGNVIVYAWTATSVANTVYVAAIDKSNGAVVLAPTATLNGASRPRLVALTTKILLFAKTTLGTLGVLALDPANPGGVLGGAMTAVLGSPAFNDYYDVVKIPTLDAAAFAARRNVTTSYEVGTVTAGLTIAQATKARTCDGPIAVSPTPDGASLQVIRANGTNIQGDLLVRSSLADTFTGQAVGTAAGTPVNQIAAAHRTVQNGGQYRCYAFWSSQEASTGTLGWECKTNFVDTGNTLGTQSVLRLRLGVASRAFDYNGEVYVWLAFAGDSYVTGVGVPLGFRAQLQNTYFLYRDDGHLASKAVWQTAGGFSYSTGRLPGVALVSGTTGFAWCGTRRRVIRLGSTDTPGQQRSNYDARSPQDITFTFDSNLARRAVRLGKTLYVSGGLIGQYDGAGVWELGIQVYPWNWSSVPGAAGAIPAGDYAYIASMRWDNAMGERERSTTATGEKITNTGTKIDFQIVPLHVTRKGTAPAIEMWRSEVNPPDGADFFLATSIDPASSGDDKYLGNLPTSAFTGTWTDNLTDATLSDRQGNPENGSVLESMAPPGARIIIASDTRLFLAGVSGDPDRVWYSRLRNDGELASFHEALTVSIPPDGGDITGLAFLNDTLVVFRETAVYLVPGDGFDNLGGGNNFGPVRALAVDVGAVNHESIAQVPQGLIFKSNKGWYLLNRGFTTEYIGGPVSGYDSETPVAVHVVEAQHHVRCMTSSRCLVFDYLIGQWAEWTLASCVHAAIWNGLYTKATATAVSTEASNFSSGVTYGMDIETAWIKLADLQGAAKLRWFEVLGEERSDDNDWGLRTRIARDYETASTDTPSYFDDRLWTNTFQTVGYKFQVRQTPSLPCEEAFKVRLTAVGGGATGATFTTATGANWTSGSTLATSGSVWTATLTSLRPGTGGNGTTLSIYTSVGPTGCEIRDNYIFDGTTWTPLTNNVGVRIGGAVTVAQLESAIGRSRLIGVAIADPSPTKTITDTNTLHSSVPWSGGTDSTPTTEAVQLTGLSLEVGFKRGLYRNIARGNKQ